MRKNLAALSLVLIVLATGFLLSTDIKTKSTKQSWDPGNFSFASKEKNDNRQRARALLKDLKKGDKFSEVESVLKAHSWPKYLLNNSRGYEDNESLLIIKTPSEFLAQNWIITVAFIDEIVSDINIGTLDNAKRLPSDINKF